VVIEIATESKEPVATAIQIIQPADIDRLAEAFKKFQDFKQRLLSPEDTIKIENKPYLKKSAWRKWALACGVSDQLLSLERVPPTGLDDKGNFFYRVVVKAFHKPTGRSAVGVAVASKSEKERWAHEEHDILTLAHTRAKNRGISDLTGGGEVSAEEMVADIRDVTPVGSSEKAKTTALPAHQVTETIQTGIPTTTEVLPPGSSCRQFPLIDTKRGSLGMMNVSDTEANLVPSVKVLANDPAIEHFLTSRVLEPLKEKHGFQYSLFSELEILKTIHVKGKLDDKQIKELQSATAWAFAKASERASP
jgi:hypothetical protein